MARLVDNKEVLEVIRNTLPQRQHKDTTFEIEHGSLNTRCLLNRDIFRGKEFC